MAQAGLDSLGAVELRNAIASHYGTSAPATLAFDYPTAAALCDYALATSAQAASTDAAAGPRGGEGPVELSQGLNMGDVAAQISKIVSNVIGGLVPADQPLMEVRRHNLCYPRACQKSSRDIAA